jgi:hypothetical protein
VARRERFGKFQGNKPAGRTRLWRIMLRAARPISESCTRHRGIRDEFSEKSSNAIYSNFPRGA